MLILAGRFLILLGLALWIGLSLSLWVQSRVLLRSYPKPIAQEITATLIPVLDRFLLAALVFVTTGHGILVSVLKVLPSNTALVMLGTIGVLRLLSTFSLSTALRALRARVKESPGAEGDHRAFQRMLGTSMLLFAVEGSIAIALLFQVS